MTLATHMATYVDEVANQDPSSTRLVLAQRAYMAGAMQAALLLKTATPEQVIAEVVAYGRTVGTSLETARITD
jgi:hypothetical protein